MKSMNSVVTVKITRFDPDKGRSWTQEYTVPLAEPTTVLGLLDLIYDNHDQTLAYRRYRCYVGICTSCQLKVNGRAVRGCSVIVNPSDMVTIEPADGRQVIRDLVTVL